MQRVTDCKNQKYNIKVKTKKHDVDIPYGEYFEKKIDKMFHDRDVEIKTERNIWMNTGNIAIEVKQYGRPSGLSITKANYWIHLLADGKKIKGGFIFPVDELKQKVKEMIKSGDAVMKPGGDYMASLNVLMPINKLL